MLNTKTVPQYISYGIALQRIQIQRRFGFHISITISIDETANGNQPVYVLRLILEKATVSNVSSLYFSISNFVDNDEPIRKYRYGELEGFRGGLHVSSFRIEEDYKVGLFRTLLLYAVCMFAEREWFTVGLKAGSVFTKDELSTMGFEQIKADDPMVQPFQPFERAPDKEFRDWSDLLLNAYWVEREKAKEGEMSTREIVDALFKTEEDILDGLRKILRKDSLENGHRFIQDLNAAYGTLTPDRQINVIDGVWQITSDISPENAEEFLREWVEDACMEPETDVKVICEGYTCKICNVFNIRANQTPDSLTCDDERCNVCEKCVRDFFKTELWKQGKCPGCNGPLTGESALRMKQTLEHPVPDMTEEEKVVLQLAVIRNRVDSIRDLEEVMETYKTLMDINYHLNGKHEIGYARKQFARGSSEHKAHNFAASFFGSGNYHIIEKCQEYAMKYAKTIVMYETEGYTEELDKAMFDFNMTPWMIDTQKYIYEDFVDRVTEGIAQMRAIDNVRLFEGDAVAVLDLMRTLNRVAPASAGVGPATANIQEPESGTTSIADTNAANVLPVLPVDALDPPPVPTDVVIDDYLEERRTASLHNLVRAWIGCYEGPKEQHDYVRDCLLSIGIVPPPKIDVLAFAVTEFLRGRTVTADYPDFIFRRNEKRGPTFGKYQVLFRDCLVRGVDDGLIRVTRPLAFDKVYTYVVSAPEAASVLQRFDEALTGYLIEMMFRNTVKTAFNDVTGLQLFLSSLRYESVDVNNESLVVSLSTAYTWYATVHARDGGSSIGEYTDTMLDWTAKYVSDGLKLVGGAGADDAAEAEGDRAALLEPLLANLRGSSFGKLCAFKILQNAYLRNPVEDSGVMPAARSEGNDMAALQLGIPTAERIGAYLAIPENRNAVAAKFIEFTKSKLVQSVTKIGPGKTENSDVENPNHMRAILHKRPDSRAYNPQFSKGRRDPPIGSALGRPKAPPPPVKRVPFLERVFTPQERQVAPKVTTQKGPLFRRWRGGASGATGGADASAVLGIVLSVCVVVASSVVGSAR